MLDFLTIYLVRPIMKKQFEYTYETEIDQYISSKNSTTTAEVGY